MENLQGFLEQRKANFEHGVIEYANMAGIVAEVLEENHLRFRLPAHKIHLNHIGTMYAGSIFVLAEIAGGNLFICAHGNDEFVPVLKSVEVCYLKPSKKDLIVDVTLSKEEAEEKIALAKERGRGDYFLDIPIYDEDGVQVVQANFNYYAIPPTKDFAGDSRKRDAQKSA